MILEPRVSPLDDPSHCMRDLISSDESSLAATAGLGCLFILALGWVVSLFLSVGKPPEKTEDPPPPVEESTVPEELRIDLPKEEPRATTSPLPASPDARRERDVIPRPAPVRKQEQTLCELILDSVAMIDSCDFLDTGTLTGSTVFLKVEGASGALDEASAAALALDTWATIEKERRRPSVVAIETSDGSWMVDREVLQECVGKGGSSVACVTGKMTRVGIR